MSIVNRFEGGGGEGGAGPAGPKGPKGADGADGAEGAEGKPGALWYSGAGDPHDIGGGSFPYGDSGDYYLDGISGDVWVYLVSDWFFTGYNIKGPQGPPGTSGPGAEGLTTLPYAAIASDYLVEGLTMGAGDEQNLLCTDVWNFTIGGDLINDGVSFQPIDADSFEPDFNGRVRITSTVVFSTSQVPSGYLVIRNNGVDVSNYEAFYKTHLDLTGTKLSSEIDIVIDVKVGDVIEPFFGVGSGSCVIHQSYTDILRLDFGVAAETVNLSTLKEIVSESTGFKDFQSKIKAL